MMWNDFIVVPPEEYVEGYTYEGLRESCHGFK